MYQTHQDTQAEKPHFIYLTNCFDWYFYLQKYVDKLTRIWHNSNYQTYGVVSMPKNLFSTLSRRCQDDCKQKMKEIFVLLHGDNPDRWALVVNILDNLNTKYQSQCVSDSGWDSDSDWHSDSYNSTFVGQYGLLREFAVDGKRILDIVLEKTI